MTLFFVNFVGVEEGVFVGIEEGAFKSTLRVLREKVKFEARKVLQISSEFTVTVAIWLVPLSEVICTVALVGSRLILYKHLAKSLLRINVYLPVKRASFESKCSPATSYSNPPFRKTGGNAENSKEKVRGSTPFART